MRGFWPQIAIAFTGVLLFTGAGQSQEHPAAPVPPWGKALEAEEPARGHRPLFHWTELFNDDEDAIAPRIWIRPEYVLSWIASSRLPPLVATGLTTDARPGALGLPFTKVLYGAAPINYEDRSGFRIAVGGLISEEHGLSVEGVYFTLGGRVQRFQSSSPGNPIIARPFFDALNNAQDSSLTTYPGYFTGNINIASTSYLQSEEINAFADIWKSESCRVRGLAGMRILNLHESLDIREASTVVNPALPQVGQTVQVQDLFRTTNNFYGVQLGVSADYHWHRFTTELFGKAAIGDLQQRVTIDGGTTFGGATTQGGLLAQSSNIGSFSRDRFGVVPEAGVKLQGAIGRHLSLHVGYSFLYLGDVVRPGNQVDLGVNPNLVPTSATFGAGANPARPAFAYQESSYWAHLFNFGFTVQY